MQPGEIAEATTERNLIPTLAGGDQLVWRFFVTFSRFECALKRAGFVKVGRHRSAGPDWDKFADSLHGRLVASQNADFLEAKTFLLTAPPRRQKLDAAEAMGWTWVPNDPQARESNERYLLRLVRDVRNNLFHGSKYPTFQ